MSVVADTSTAALLNSRELAKNTLKYYNHKHQAQNIIYGFYIQKK